MKIFIVGGGFAGIKAAKQLSKKVSKENEIYLIDKNEYTTMLPNLPELTSGRLKEKDITEKISSLLPRRVKFLKEEITNINLDMNEITTSKTKYTYDYLVMAAGSTTNLYGFNQHLENVNLLDSLEAANNVRERFEGYIRKTENPTLVVSGAGFTGIELACNLYDYAKKQGKKLNVVFVELAKKVLPMLSEKSSSHVMGKLKKLDFKIYTENQIAQFDGENITLKNDEIIKDVFFCWCSGVKSSLKPIGNYASLPDGRIIVDEYLSIPNYKEVYAAGDAAAIKGKDGKFLRRAVTFAEMSGKHAGKNIAAAINNGSKSKFNPIDLGWIIPLYISSIGEAMGVEVRGRKGIFMHYILCGIKNYSFKNFGRELIAAFKYPFTKI
ncbi:FAD-dependent oxidoreductase [Clostridium sp. YIM B02515]|uniref:FAD-dependent oxidoreductase n=1 Tax=Clostridium rhizosphaerae TaxID=2803861 RepID=A0ABS1T639_9CLOT|nr:FAD-dependent oxidoreductase [Clostridium rhizosphaerae]MBL4934817.1 FAD-dependent oxidoreductase [Clostridium rhizosphaerae]